jgi:hypothetical protein
MTKTRGAWNDLCENLRLALASVLMGWVLRLVPKTDACTLLGIHAVLTGMMKDDERRDSLLRRRGTYTSGTHEPSAPPSQRK